MSTTSNTPASTYIARREEAVIRDQVEKVRSDRTTRALLIYGPGGAGKTVLVKEMAQQAGAAGGDVVWVPPIDVDDSEYWLLSNLETAVAGAVDPAGEHFKPYFDYLARLSRYEQQQRVSYETVVTQLGRINRTFTECYRTFVQSTGRTVVIALDTIEAIRSMYLVLTLTQWMKQLPATLFILSGRPLSRREHQDPIREELSDPHHPLMFSEIDLRGFDDAEAKQFLRRSDLDDTLPMTQQNQLIALTMGQPLWLALAVEYLQSNDLPPEMTIGLDQQYRPQEQFRRRLTGLYRGTDFWPEAIKRLAVVRHSVNQDVWQRLMVDRGLPPDTADWDEAWAKLLQRPWVRPRANRRYVTLHDALAEELAQRLIPLHDQDETWQRDLWRRAKGIYTELTAGKDERLPAERRRLTAALGSLEADRRVVREVAHLDAQKRELDQLQTAQLHYAILDDFGAGTEQFLRLYDQASNHRDPLFMELICHEIERFVPRGETSQPLEDVMGGVLRRFQRWLRDDAPERHIEIAVRLAGFLIGNEQASPALELLSNLPDESTVSPQLRYRLANERGNASMRVPGQIDAAQGHFRVALNQASNFTEPDSVLRQAEAHKELGFYYRNLGRWPEADDAYQTARDVLSRVMGPGSPEKHREEMASIQTNWAYLKALRGDYSEARNLVDSAIGIRRRIEQWHGVGVSLSVSGEVYRYDGKFLRAWKEYKEAETIFHEFKSWPWLGLLYQEMAICLYHATREGTELEEDQQAQAGALIRQSLDICRDSAIRSYPSALNRAGRIPRRHGHRPGLE